MQTALLVRQGTPDLRVEVPEAGLPLPKFLEHAVFGNTGPVNLTEQIAFTVKKPRPLVNMQWGSNDTIIKPGDRVSLMEEIVLG